MTGASSSGRSASTSRFFSASGRGERGVPPSCPTKNTESFAKTKFVAGVAVAGQGGAAFTDNTGASA
jgi:hypothetical protein